MKTKKKTPKPETFEQKLWRCFNLVGCNYPKGITAEELMDELDSRGWLPKDYKLRDVKEAMIVVFEKGVH